MLPWMIEGLAAFKYGKEGEKEKREKTGDVFL